MSKLLFKNIDETMNKLKLTGRNLGRISSLGSVVLVQAMNCIHFVKPPNLKLKTWPKQLLGYLPLAFELPNETHTFSTYSEMWRNWNIFVTGLTKKIMPFKNRQKFERKPFWIGFHWGGNFNGRKILSECDIEYWQILIWIWKNEKFE